MRNVIVIALTGLLLTGCVTQHRAGHRDPAHQDPAHGFGTALGYLIASPVLILAALFEGIATAPYFIEADLHAMNREMEKADANVSLDRTYRHAYGRSLDTVPKSGSTGRVFRHMGEATAHFQDVLRGPRSRKSAR